jgi:dTDP-4-amino-4,6-dideoxygalactose transaminase
MSRAALRPFDTPILVGKPRLPDLDRFIGRLRTIWGSGWLTNCGAQHAELEATLREALDVPRLSLFNNGTMALLAACRALDLTGEVITTPFTFPATPHVLSWSRLQPVFADIDPATLNIDPACVEALITPATSAILAVHAYGTPCDVDSLQAIAARHGLKVIYDAAHAFGVRVRGRGIGCCGDATAFSFHATKLFHTAEGGAFSTSDPALADRINLLRNFGIVSEEEVELPGLNGKMSELHAALGLTMLEELEDERRHRRAVAEIYLRELAGVPGVTLPALPPDGNRALQYFVIRVDGTQCGCSRDTLQQRLRTFNVFTRKYFYPLCSEYPSYRHLPSAAARRLPVAHQAAREVLCLPLHAEVAPAQARTICQLIRSFTADAVARPLAAIQA